MSEMQAQMMAIMSSPTPDTARMQALMMAQTEVMAEMTALTRLQQQQPAPAVAPHPESFASLTDDYRKLATQ